MKGVKTGKTVSFMLAGGEGCNFISEKDTEENRSSNS